MKILLETDDQVLVKLHRDEWDALCRAATRNCGGEFTDGYCGLMADLQRVFQAVYKWKHPEEKKAIVASSERPMSDSAKRNRKKHRRPLKP